MADEDAERAELSPAPDPAADDTQETATEGGSDETLAVLYDETTRTLNRQFETVEGLNARAQQILGFAAVIISVIAAFGTRDESDWVQSLIVVDLALFAVVGALAFAAWRFQQYRDDPDVEQLYENYKHKPVNDVRDQVIGNRFDSIRHNDAVIKRKWSLIRDAAWILAAAALVLIAIVVVRLFDSGTGDSRPHPYYSPHGQQHRPHERPRQEGSS